MLGYVIRYEFSTSFLIAVFPSKFSSFQLIRGECDEDQLWDFYLIINLQRDRKFEILYETLVLCHM
jgi:hypothetical protein